MSDKLFSLAKQIEQLKQQSQANFSEATAFNESDFQSISENRLAQLEQTTLCSRHPTSSKEQNRKIPVKQSEFKRSAFGESFSQTAFAEQLARQEDTKLTSAFHHKRLDIGYFVDKLFLPDVRSELLNEISKSIASDQKEAWLITNVEQEIILGCWLNVWNKTLQDATNPLIIRPTSPINQNLLNQTHPSDINLITHLCKYINGHKLCMYVPDLQKVNAVNNKVKYKLTGYSKKNINSIHGNPVHLKDFLKLLAAGAHFVIIDSSKDNKRTNGQEIPSFYDTFLSNSALATYHSHYATVIGPLPASGGNLKSAKVYPDFISGDITPDICPFIVSLLIGRTAWSMPFIGDYNSFLQLEGWPQTGLTSKRHGQDYKVHSDTKWNISTYGACPYSEKRGATVFLAHAQWNPQPTSGTIMAPYVGAETVQSWLDKTLIE